MMFSAILGRNLILICLIGNYSSTEMSRRTEITKRPTFDAIVTENRDVSSSREQFGITSSENVTDLEIGEKNSTPVVKPCIIGGVSIRTLGNETNRAPAVLRTLVAPKNHSFYGRKEVKVSGKGYLNVTVDKFSGVRNGNHNNFSSSTNGNNSKTKSFNSTYGRAAREHNSNVTSRGTMADVENGTGNFENVEVLKIDFSGRSVTDPNKQSARTRGDGEIDVALDGSESLALNATTDVVGSEPNLVDGNISEWGHTENNVSQDVHGAANISGDASERRPNFRSISTNVTFVTSFLSSIILVAIIVVLSVNIHKTVNLTGSCVLCLAISLTISNIFSCLPFVGNSFGQNGSNFCEVILTIFYVGFLSSQCWANIIAFNVWKVFTVYKFKVLPQMNRKRCTSMAFVYMIGGWAIPLLLITVSVVTFKQHQPLLDRNSRHSVCFNLNHEILRYSFDIPMVFLFSVNMITFGLAARGHAKPNAHCSTPKRNSQGLKIYVILSGLLGSCWMGEFLSRLVSSYNLQFGFLVFHNAMMAVVVVYMFKEFTYKHIVKIKCVAKTADNFRRRVVGTE